MRLLPTAIALIIFGTTYSQVGIGNNTPQSDLHISKTASDGGSIQIDGGIRVGGNNTTPGSKGSPGQVLVSNGSTVEWRSIGNSDDHVSNGYFSDCAIPKNIVYIDFNLPSGSNVGVVNVTRAQVSSALLGLPEGGVIVLRTNSATTYTHGTTYLTVELPSTAGLLNKPFTFTFDGPPTANNIIDQSISIEIILVALNNSNMYEYDLGSAIPKMIYKKFPASNKYNLSELKNTSAGDGRKILLFNSSTIKAIDDETWAFLTPECYVQNPRKP